MKRTAFSACAVFLSCAFFLQAETIFEIPALISNNVISVQKRLLQLKQEEIGVNNIIFEYFPSLSLRYSGGLNNIFRAYSFSPAHSITLGSSWNILESADRIFENRQRRLNYENAQYDFDSFFDSAVYSVMDEYVTALKNKTSYELAQSNLTLSKAQFDFVTAQRNRGSASALDAVKAQADYDSALYSLEESRIKYDNALTQLRNTLRKDTLDVEPITAVYTTPLELDDLLAEYGPDVFTNRTRKTLENKKRIAEIDRTVAFKNRFIPSVSLDMGVDWWDATYGNPYGWESTTLDGRITLSVSLPIFEQNTKLNAWRKSALAVESAELDIEANETTALNDLVQYVNAHNNQTRLRVVAERQLESARMNYEMTRDSYQMMGGKSLIDYYEALNAYRSAEQSLQSTTFDIILSRLKIGNLIGDTMRFLRDE